MKAQLVLVGLVVAIGACSASELVCPEQFDPMNPTLLPHPDCTKYYMCNWQDLIERSCPSGLHWNQKMNYCDYPGVAGCVAGSTPDVSVTSTTSTAKPLEDCPEVYDPSHQVYFPHDDCSKYYICTYEGNKLEQNCPTGLHWSQTSGYCDRPEAAKCEVVQPEEPATEVPQVVECPEGYDPEHPVYFPHEQCDSFYQCVNGQAVEQKCPGDLHWNQDKGYCDLAEQAGCVAVTEQTSTEVEVSSTGAPSTTASSTEAPSTTTPKPSTEAPAPGCPQEESDVPVFLPHPDCTKYYMCVHGHPIELNCPPGTFWNATADVCDNPASSGCHQERVPK